MSEASNFATQSFLDDLLRNLAFPDQDTVLDVHSENSPLTRDSPKNLEFPIILHRPVSKRILVFSRHI